MGSTMEKIQLEIIFLICKGSNNTYYWGYRRVALRAMQISDTFRQVWGDCAINDRVRIVLACQVIFST